MLIQFSDGHGGPCKGDCFTGRMARWMLAAVCICAAVGCSSESTSPEGASTTESAAATADDPMAAPISTGTPSDAPEAAAAANMSEEVPDVAPTPVLTIEQPAPLSPLKGLSRPQLVSDEAATLEDEAMVVGVVVGGEPRAYALPAMDPPGSPVINDVIGQTSVTVTWCPARKMVRVLSDPSTQAPLDIRYRLLDSAGLSLWIGSANYDQQSGTMPLADMDFVQTAWIAWKSEHPGGKVYVGAGL